MVVVVVVVLVVVVVVLVVVVTAVVVVAVVIVAVAAIPTKTCKSQSTLIATFTQRRSGTNFFCEASREKFVMGIYVK